MRSLRNEMGDVQSKNFEDDERIAAALLEQTKLKHRLTILNNVSKDL